MKNINYDDYEEYIPCINRVKKLTLLPVFDSVTIDMLSEYFEIPTRPIRDFYNRNRIKLLEYGVRKLLFDDFKNAGYIRTMNRKGSKAYKYGDDVFSVNNAGTLAFSVKSVLFIAMNLDISHIAVRIQQEIEQSQGNERYTTVDVGEIDKQIQTSDGDSIQVFSNAEFGSVRTLAIDGQPWFVGKDVAVALGYKEPTKAARDRVDVEDRGVSKIDTPSGTQSMTIINESGLYSLVLSSKLPTAKKFKRWVTSEVLPSVRKHGAYMTSDTLEKALTSPDFLIKLATQLKTEQEKNKQLTRENRELTIENNALELSNSTWEHRSIINALMRAYARHCCGDVIPYAYGNLYRELLYNHHIDLRRRKGDSRRPYIDFLREDELDTAVSVATTICKRKGLNVSRIINEVNEKRIQERC